MMAEEAGVVKSVNGGMVRALNDLTGEIRQVSTAAKEKYRPSGQDLTASSV